MITPYDRVKMVERSVVARDPYIQSSLCDNLGRAERRKPQESRNRLGTGSQGIEKTQARVMGDARAS